VDNLDVQLYREYRDSICTITIKEKGLDVFRQRKKDTGKQVAGTSAVFETMIGRHPMLFLNSLFYAKAEEIKG